MLCEHFPLRGDMSASAHRYNRILTDRYYELLDFVQLHYRLSEHFTDASRAGGDRPRARVLDSVVTQLQQARATLPRRERWLRTVCGMPDYGESRSQS